MKIYKFDFEPMWPVPYGLIVAANNLKEAEKIARKTVTHTDKVWLDEEIELENGSQVIFYESGDY